MFIFRPILMICSVLAHSKTTAKCWCQGWCVDWAYWWKALRGVQASLRSLHYSLRWTCLGHATIIWEGSNYSRKRELIGLNRLSPEFNLALSIWCTQAITRTTPCVYLCVRVCVCVRVKWRIADSEFDSHDRWVCFLGGFCDLSLLDFRTTTNNCAVEYLT